MPTYISHMEQESGKMLRGWSDSDVSITETSVHSAPAAIDFKDYSYTFECATSFCS